jgi:integrase
MANVYLRGKTWWGRAQKNGQELRRSLETRSESLARERLRVWLDELDDETWGKRPKVTLNEAADAFIREHLPTLRPKSIQRYGVSIKWLDDKLGLLQLAAIGTKELKEFETWRRSMGASAPTIRRDMACLSSIYSFAMENEWIELNPVSAFLKARKKRGLKESPPRTRYLSHAEEARLLEAAIPRVRDAILFAIYSGLREEEQFSLTWDRVDLDQRQVVIPKEITKGKRDRTAILLDEAVAVLRTIPRHFRSKYVFFHGASKNTADGIKRGRKKLSDKDGNRFRHLLRALKLTATRAKVPDLIWHDLRRTHGCRLLQDLGWSLEMVRDQLGHSTLQQTEKAYAFLEVETRREAAGTKTGTGFEAKSHDLSEVTRPAQGKRAAQKPAQGKRISRKS